MSDFEMMRRKSDKALVRVYSKDTESQSGWWHCGVKLSDGHWTPISIRPDNLEPIPRKHKLTVWINVYPGIRIGLHHTSRRDADNAGAGCSRIACLKFEREFEDGEGL